MSSPKKEYDLERLLSYVLRDGAYGLRPYVSEP